MKTSKEQLIKDIAKLEAKLNESIRREENTLNEFAIAFGQMKQDMFSRHVEPQELSWERVFVKLGKLLQIEQEVKDKNELEFLRRRNEELIRIQEKEEHKKKCLEKECQ